MYKNVSLYILLEIEVEFYVDKSPKKISNLFYQFRIGWTNFWQI